MSHPASTAGTQLRPIPDRFTLEQDGSHPRVVHGSRAHSRQSAETVRRTSSCRSKSVRFGLAEKAQLHPRHDLPQVRSRGRYGIVLDGEGADALFGVIYVSARTGKPQRAYLVQDRGDERIFTGADEKPKSTLSRSWSLEISTTSLPVVPLTVTVPRFSLAVGPLAASAAVATTPTACPDSGVSGRYLYRAPWVRSAVGSRHDS